MNNNRQDNLYKTIVITANYNYQLPLAFTDALLLWLSSVAQLVQQWAENLGQCKTFGARLRRIDQFSSI